MGYWREGGGGEQWDTERREWMERVIERDVERLTKGGGESDRES